MHESRREFLSVAAGACAIAMLRPDGLARVMAADREAGDTPPGELASQERFWFQVQNAFTVDRSVINLNNGGVNPAPRIVQDAMRRHLDFANQSPARNLWRVQEPEVETVRQRLARMFGCDPEEMAITRNASEALEIAIMGLNLEPGDEILTTELDYPRMVHAIKQRELREGIVAKTFSYPTPPPSMNYLAEQYEKHITPRTKALLVCHMTTYTGQIFPVKQVCTMARKHGVKSIVDGAHAFGHFVFDGGDIGCDFYGNSLHKWMTAPHGTGFLYVRKENIVDHWPLMAAQDPRSPDIRKFEEIGTHPAANRLAISEALTFYEGIGPARKEARLRYLRNRFAERLAANDRVKLLTNLDPAQSCAMATLNFDGLDHGKLVSHLWNKHKIVVISIDYAGVQGIRISPNVYTTLTEIDMFCDAVEHVLKNGLPA